MTVIAKMISMGRINNVKGGFAAPAEKTLVCTLIGVARGYKEKKKEMPDGKTQISYAFSGEFTAYNKDNEEFIAPVCYVPGPADEMLKGVLDQEGVNDVKVAFRFYIVPDAASATKYVYLVEPMMEVKPTDALAELRQQLADKLPAPKNTPLPGPSESSGGADSVPDPKNNIISEETPSAKKPSTKKG